MQPATSGVHPAPRGTSKEKEKRKRKIDSPWDETEIEALRTGVGREGRGWMALGLATGLTALVSLIFHQQLYIIFLLVLREPRSFSVFKKKKENKKQKAQPIVRAKKLRPTQPLARPRGGRLKNRATRRVRGLANPTPLLRLSWAVVCLWQRFFAQMVVWRKAGHRFGVGIKAQPMGTRLAHAAQKARPTPCSALRPYCSFPPSLSFPLSPQ